MDMRNWGAGRGLAVLEMMIETEERLNQEESEDDSAEDGVCRCSA